MRHPAQVIPSTGTTTRAKRRLIRSYTWSSLPSIWAARRRRVRSNVSTFSSGWNPRRSSWEDISGSFTSRRRTSMSWSSTRASSESVTSGLHQDLPHGGETGRVQELLTRAGQSRRTDDLGDQLQIDRVALQRRRHDQEQEVGWPAVQGIEFDPLGRSGNEK